MASSVVDLETGEVLKEPEFVKLYIKEVCSIRGLNSSQTKIFQFMLSEMNWHNEVCYGTTSKQRFLDAHNMKNQTFNNNITALIDSGLIAREGKGAFKVNPKYASKVEWAKVKKITWVTEYTENGKQETVDVFFNDEAVRHQTPPEPEPAPPPPPKAKAKPKAKKPAKKATQQPYEWPKPEDIDQPTWDDWLMIRKTKRQPITQRAIDMMNTQASNYGISFVEAVVICVERGWGGFKAEYMENVVGFGGKQKGPKTIDQFMKENEEQAQRVLASGMLDDIF